MFGRSKAAVAFWLSGRRRMSAKEMADFAASLRESADVLNGLPAGIADAADQVRIRGHRARGFQKVQDWGDGIECDRRIGAGAGERNEERFRS